MRRASLFWHAIWDSAGRPLHGVLADIRRGARRRYHAVVRSIKAATVERTRFDMAIRYATQRSKGFWGFVKRLSGSKNQIPSHINNLTQHSEISDLFKSKYETLYNSQCTSIQQVTRMQRQLSYVRGNGLAAGDVEAAIAKLRCGKADGCFEGLSSDCFKHAPASLSLHICFLFQLCIQHGYFPQAVCDMQFLPLLKAGKINICNADNYRAISQGSIIFKIFEILFKQISISSSISQ